MKSPAPVQQEAVNQSGGKKGEVDRLPLDNLKAEKYTTKDGREGWKISIPGNRPLATPAVVDGMVFVGGGFGSYEFYAFDAETGKPAWAIRVNDDGPTAAVVARGVVAFNTESCTLFVVDARTGRQLWSKWLGDPLMSQPAISEDKIFMAFPGSRGHQLIALALKNGEEAWRADIEGDIISAPVIYKDSVYLSTFDGTVYRFRMADGEQIWKKDFQATSAPWLYNDQVFVSKRENDAGAKPMEGIARMDKRQGHARTRKKAYGTKKPLLILTPKCRRNPDTTLRRRQMIRQSGFASAPGSAKTERPRPTWDRARCRAFGNSRGQGRA